MFVLPSDCESSGRLSKSPRRNLRTPTIVRCIERYVNNFIGFSKPAPPDWLGSRSAFGGFNRRFTRDAAGLAPQVSDSPPEARYAGFHSHGSVLCGASRRFRRVRWRNEAERQLMERARLLPSSMIHKLYPPQKPVFYWVPNYFPQNA